MLTDSCTDPDRLGVHGLCAWNACMWMVVVCTPHQLLNNGGCGVAQKSFAAPLAASYADASLVFVGRSVRGRCIGHRVFAGLVTMSSGSLLQARIP